MLYRLYSNKQHKYVNAKDCGFTLGEEGNNNKDYTVEFSSGKCDVNNKELFENDLIQMYGYTYIIYYNNVKASWDCKFINDRAMKANEYPKYNIVKPNEWPLCALYIGNIRDLEKR